MAEADAKPAPSDAGFTTPPGQRFGDAALTALLAAVLLLPLLAAGERVYLAVLGLCVLWLCAAAAAATLGPAPWRLSITRDAVQVGRHRLPLSEITLLRVGASTPLSRSGATGQLPASAPLVIAGRHGRQHAIRLRRADADRALAEIHARTGGAAGVDSTGREYLPRSPAARAEGERRLGRLWALRAAVHLAFASVATVVLALGLVTGRFAAGAPGAGPHVGWEVLVASGALVASVTYGLWAIRRARADHLAARARQAASDPGPGAGQG